MYVCMFECVVSTCVCIHKGLKLMMQGLVLDAFDLIHRGPELTDKASLTSLLWKSSCLRDLDLELQGGHLSPPALMWSVGPEGQSSHCDYTAALSPRSRLPRPCIIRIILGKIRVVL